MLVLVCGGGHWGLQSLCYHLLFGLASCIVYKHWVVLDTMAPSMGPMDASLSPGDSDVSGAPLKVSGGSRASGVASTAATFSTSAWSTSATTELAEGSEEELAEGVATDFPSQKMHRLLPWNRVAGASEDSPE